MFEFEFNHELLVDDVVDNTHWDYYDDWSHTNVLAKMYSLIHNRNALLLNEEIHVLDRCLMSMKVVKTVHR